MTQPQDHDFATLDAALSRLPCWNPPDELAARLAAAAARQQTAASPRRGWPKRWLDALPDLSGLVSMTVGGVLVAGTLGWVVPWERLSQGPGIAWLAMVVLGASGLSLTWRLLQWR